MRGSMKLVSMLLVLCLTLGALPLAMAEEVVDADLTCTITLGNWPADTAAEAEKALFESYRETMKKQYPNVTLVPDYYSYTLSSYVPMAKGGTAPSIFQPPFTDPQLLISQHLVGDVTDALERAGVLNEFSPSYLEMLSDENGRIYGLPRDGYVLGMHINVALFREAGLVDEEGIAGSGGIRSDYPRKDGQGGSCVPGERDVWRLAVHQYRVELRLRGRKRAGISG